MTLPRGTCYTCRRTVVLRNDGTTKKHKPTAVHKRTCKGSHTMPVESRGRKGLRGEVLREKLGGELGPLTQEQLGRLLCLSSRTIMRIEQTGEPPAGAAGVIWQALERLAENAPRRIRLRWPGPIPTDELAKIWKQIL